MLINHKRQLVINFFLSSIWKDSVVLICCGYVLDGYNPKRQTHRSMLLCLLMTSCDLSDQTKGWKTTRKIAVSLDLTVTLISSDVQARV